MNTVSPTKKAKPTISLNFKIPILIFLVITTIMLAMLGMYYLESNQALIRKGEQELLLEAHARGAQLQENLTFLKNDVKFLSKVPPIHGIIRAQQNKGIDPVDGSSQEIWKQRLSSIFKEMLSSKSNYTQIAYISAEKNFLALVHEGKEAPSIHDIEFYEKIINSPDKQVILSEVNLEDGDNSALAPMLNAAIPVYDNVGEIFGFILVTVNYTEILDQLSRQITNKNIYIVNSQGNYLLSSNQVHTQNKLHKIQNDYPLLAKVFSNEKEVAHLISKPLHYKKEFIMFVKIPLDQNDNTHFLGLALVQNTNQFLFDAINFRNRSLVFALSISIFILILAIILARYLTAPLKVMRRWVEAIEKGEAENIKLPQSNDEIGVLSASFQKLVASLKQSKDEISLLYQNTKIAQEAKNVPQALEESISLICKTLNWPVGHAYFLLKNDQSRLTPSGIWYSEDKQLTEEFRKITGQIYLHKGEGLPGKVWEQLQPIWIKDIQTDDSILRPRHCTDLCLHSAVAVPIIVWNRLVAVLEFFSYEAFPEDQDMLMMLFSIGKQIGRVWERRESEKLIEESEVRNRTLIETAMDCIVVINAHGIIEQCNHATEITFGYTTKELVGENIKKLMPEPYRSNHDQYLKNYICTRQAKIMGTRREVVAQRKNGEEFPAEICINEMKIDNKWLFSGTVRDLTEVKQLEKLKNQFVSVVSHELRTPLTSIRGSLGLVAHQLSPELPQKSLDLIQIANSNCLRLSKLVNDILDMEKIQAGKIDFVFEETDIIPFIKKVIHENEAYAREHGVTLSFTPKIASTTVLIDQDRINQVLTNLISNAVKFSPMQENVNIDLSIAQGKVNINVADKGPGIPTEHHQSIFSPFTQVDTSDSRQKQGSGLGLTISKQIIERHGGKILLNSAPGAGTTFIIELMEYNQKLKNVSNI
jgi:PAS domain S-box-containing protein